MGPAKKLDQEELDKLRGFEGELLEVVTRIGGLVVGIEDLKEQLEESRKVRSGILEEYKEYAKNLAEKYGDGSVNLEKGEFTPSI